MSCAFKNEKQTKNQTAKEKMGLTNKGFVVMIAQKPLLKNFQLGKYCWGECSLKSLLILTTKKVSSTDYALDIRHLKITKKDIRPVHNLSFKDSTTQKTTRERELAQ